jgi:regulator of protease activity HflC (stomatin/prohibitin superfamily)
MSEFFTRLLDFLREFWPVRICMQWERANVFRAGKYWKTVGPGWYLVVPFFWDFQSENIVRATYVTPLQTIDTKDGGTLTFSATIQVEVADLRAAQLTVFNYSETAVEDTSALLADTLMRTSASLLTPENRTDLLRKCLGKLQEELGEYGLSIRTLRFNNFMRNMRVYRLFNDQAYTNHG